MKKIAILTQPLIHNYGGILQAYALQRYLQDLGNDVWLVNRFNPRLSAVKRLKHIIKNVYLNKVYSFNPDKYKGKHTTYFINKYVNPKTSKIYTETQMLSLNKSGFDAFIVGSDQVWRPSYSPSIGNYFFDFLNVKSKSKRISYAASFGVDNWLFSESQTKKIKHLIKEFDAISVREFSGIDLCKDNLNIEATQVLDPTMLLDVSKYEQLVIDEKENSSQGDLFTYILDFTQEKKNIVNDIADKLGYIPFSILPNQVFGNEKEKKNKIIEPVTKWIKSFIDAKFIVTDSFHGTVFSILFNKDFLVIGNKRRGLARFNTLLKIFGLENRLIVDINLNVNEIELSNINWVEVNEILEREKNRSKYFLKSSLDI